MLQAIEPGSQSLQIVHPNTLLVRESVITGREGCDPVAIAIAVAIARKTPTVEMAAIPLGFGRASRRGVFRHHALEHGELENVESKCFLGKVRQTHAVTQLSSSGEFTSNCNRLVCFRRSKGTRVAIYEGGDQGPQAPARLAAASGTE